MKATAYSNIPVYVHIRINIYIHIYIYTKFAFPERVSFIPGAGWDAHLYVSYMYLCMYVCTYVCAYIYFRSYIYSNTYMYINTHIYNYIFLTYIYTHTF